MGSKELVQKFLDFFEKNGHTVVPSSSLVPDDPSVLFTTAGMQQFKPYYSELNPEITVHPLIGRPVGRNAASIQKSMRTSDIDEVGDESHLTFFEMLGNFSFGYKPGEPSSPRGGYFKREAIKYAYDFFKEINLHIEYVTIFGGHQTLQADEESEKIWRDLGVKDIRRKGIEDNFWGPTGANGPCGPTTEIYARDTEIWNIVFNEYFSNVSLEELLAGDASAFLEKMPTLGVDTGMGLERLAMVSQGAPTVFETDLFKPILSAIIEIARDKPINKMRVIADHLRAAVFLIADGVEPSNTDRGYVVRRLIRRAMVAHYKFIGAGLSAGFYEKPAQAVIDTYKFQERYEEIFGKQGFILETIGKETERFRKVLESGLKELNKMGNLSGRQAFDLYQSLGLPSEVIREFKDFSQEEFDKAKAEHAAVSAVGSETKFGGHGLILDTGELKARDQDEFDKVLRLHTATHLLHAALRKVLGGDARQMGSDITAERLRFDFTFPRKLTSEELTQVENIANQKVKEALEVKREEMSREEAMKSGALAFFKEKYPERVSVYTIFDSETGEVFSKEFCGGPHVTNTKEIGHIKIIKEEAVGQGVRRIRAVLASDERQ